MKCILTWDIFYIYSGDDPDKPCVFPFKWEGVTYYRCTDFYRWEKVENEKNITNTFYNVLIFIQNQCATEVDEEGEYISNKHGTCGPDCPGEGDYLWLTDDTLVVTHHQTSKDEENSLDNSDLPDTLLVSSTSSAAETWPSLMGVYSITNKTYSGRPVWRHIVHSYQLYYSGN